MTTVQMATAAVAVMRSITEGDTAGAIVALDGLDRDDVYGLKWYAEQFIAVVLEKFESMPEEVGSALLALAPVAAPPVPSRHDVRPPRPAATGRHLRRRWRPVGVGGPAAHPAAGASRRRGP